MTRKLFTLATTLIALAAFSVPRAYACLSCDYVPEVLHAPSKSAAPKQQYKAPARARTPRVEKEARRQPVERPAKQHIEKRERVIVERSKPDRDDRDPQADTEKQADTAKIAEPEKDVETSKKEDTVKDAETSKNAPVETTAVNEKATTAASNAGEAAEPDDTKGRESAKAGKGEDCKKYFPAARVTISVPCE